MISRKYGELLPSYLDGENIRRHAGILEAEDSHVDSMLELLSMWCKLERPILIQRIGENGADTVVVHVNTHTPIKSITITGIKKNLLSVMPSVEINETITPEELTNTQTTTLNLGRYTIESLHVTVITETHTYTKGYPENTPTMGNEYDHDIFLDKIGKLLGITRRTYKKDYDPNSYTIPPYCISETEDDYYYKERINALLQSTTILEKIQAITSAGINYYTSTDDIPVPLLSGAVGLKEGSGYLSAEVPNIDYSNFQEIISQYYPITRPAYFFQPETDEEHSTVELYSVQPYINRLDFIIRVVTSSMNYSLPLARHWREVEVAVEENNTYYSNSTDFEHLTGFVSDDDGNIHLRFYGVPAGTTTTTTTCLTLSVALFKIPETATLPLGDITLFTLDPQAWHYTLPSNNSLQEDDLITPTQNNDEYLDTGRGYYTHTPAINKAYFTHLNAYTIEIVFHATNNGQIIGLGSVNTETGAITNDLLHTTDYDSYNYATSHTLTIKFLQGMAYLYLDDEHLDRTDYTQLPYNALLSIITYNTHSTEDNNGLYIESITADNTVNITVPLNINDWEYAKMNGTSVPDASLIAPTITNGELSTGRGNVVYYTTPLPTDLSEYTLRVKCHGTRRYNRLGIGTITTNNDSTISIDTSKVGFLGDLVGSQNDNTSYEVEFKFLDGICYIYLDGTYTGLIRDYSSVSDDLYLVAFSNSQYGGSITPVVIESLSYVDCVDLNTIPTTGGGAMIRTLPTDLTTSWTFVEHSTTNRTPVVNSDGTFDCGHNYHTLIHGITNGNEYSFIIDFNNTATSFYFCFVRFNNDAVQNLVSFNNSKLSDPSDLTTGNNRLVLTVASDGKVTAYFKTDSYEIGTVYSGNPYSLDAINFNLSNTLTVDSIRVCDSVLSSTEIQNILGGT